MRNGRGLHPAWGVLLGAVSMAALVRAGLEATAYLPTWGEAQPRCVQDGECTPAAAEAALRTLWWVVSAAAAGVLLGVGLVARGLSPGRRGPSPRSLPPGSHAVVAGLAGALGTAVVGLPALTGLLISAHAALGGLLGVWLVPATAVALADQLARAPCSSPRRAWLSGLVISPLATIGTGVVLMVAGGLLVLPLVPLVHGTVLALLVYLDRRSTEAATPAVPPAVPAAPPVRVDAARVLVLVLAVLTGLGVLGGLRALVTPTWAGVAALDRPVEPVPVPPVPSPSDPPPVLPSPAPQPRTQPPAPVEASVPCTTDDLSFAVPAFDAAMGARASNVQATNVGPAPCWVEGTPVVTLLQGGRPLTLAVEPGRTPSGEPAVAQRVPLAPGDSAFAFLTWRTYAGWADAETPQTVTVALDPTAAPERAAVNTDFGPAPFDLADGGTWAVAPWAPPAWDD